VQGVQIDAQYGFAQHAQQNYYMQGVEAASGIAPPSGTTIDGFKRDVSVLAGTGFHDGAGQGDDCCCGSFNLLVFAALSPASRHGKARPSDREM